VWSANQSGWGLVLCFHITASFDTWTALPLVAPAAALYALTPNAHGGNSKVAAVCCVSLACVHITARFVDPAMHPASPSLLSLLPSLPPSTFGQMSPCSPSSLRTASQLVFLPLQLMSKLAPLVGHDITRCIFLPRFAELCTDPLFHVRKVCAANFGDMCTVVGQQSTEEVLVS
jgi:hypothetical protein